MLPHVCPFLLTPRAAESETEARASPVVLSRAPGVWRAAKGTRLAGKLHGAGSAWARSLLMTWWSGSQGGARCSSG